MVLAPPSVGSPTLRHLCQTAGSPTLTTECNTDRNTRGPFRSPRANGAPVVVITPHQIVGSVRNPPVARAPRARTAGVGHPVRQRWSRLCVGREHLAVA